MAASPAAPSKALRAAAARLPSRFREGFSLRRSQLRTRADAQSLVPTPRSATEGWLTWLRHQHPYAAQPYEQLAAALRQGGDAAAANEVLFASAERDHELRAGLILPGLLWLYRYSVGYGYYPQYALLWASFFIICGIFVLWATGEDRRNGMPYGVTYSIDMFVPGIQLRKSNYDINLVGFARIYFYVHRSLGYMLAVFIAAALATLLPK